MPERLVVSFRGVVSRRSSPAGTRSAGEDYLARALALKKRAEALGATLCAWSAQTFSFDFDVEELEEAVALAVAAARPGSVVPARERFGVGISQGQLDVVSEGGSLAALSWGQPLLVAVALARDAKPGEVLVDPELPAMKSGRLAPALHQPSGAEGVALDLATPWRPADAVGPTWREPLRLVGRARELDEMAVPVGCLGLVRARPGAGGSRLLEELVRQANPSRVLFLGPVGSSREPLGAVRRALARSAAKDGAPTLPERLRAPLHRLLAGEGADLWSVAEVLDAWLAPEGGRFAMLVVDDAADVNPVSLEAVAHAINVRGAFRMIARLAVDSTLPSSLAAIPAGSTLQLDALPPAEAQELAAAFVDGELPAEAARRCATAGAGLPLAIDQALLEYLDDRRQQVLERAAPGTAAKAGGIADPAAAIARRFAAAAGGERAVLTALALLGGDASEAMVDELSVGMVGLEARHALAAGTLLSGGWLTRPEPGWFKLRSRTAVAAILGAVPTKLQREWHLAAAEMLRAHGGSLGGGDAAWHAFVGGDRDLAARLACDAARAAARASLESAQKTLLAFAEQCDAALTAEVRRELGILRASLPAPPPSVRPPLDGFEHGTALPIKPDSVRDPFDTVLDDAVFARFDPTRSVPPPPLAPRVSEASPGDEVGTSSPPIDAPAERRAADPATPAAEVTVIERAPFSGLFPSDAPPAASLAARAREALAQGDIATLERLVAELRQNGEHAELCERMTGFIALGRGAKADALRRLRTAAEATQPPAQQARARLAYGVALAAAGRSEPALLETLQALARAREADDKQGERACARFLERLSHAGGNTDAAAAWARVAQRPRRDAAASAGSGR